MVVMNDTDTLQPFTVEVSVSELPESIIARFPKKLPANTRIAVTIEPAEDEAEKLSSLRRDLQAGIDDLEAGRMDDAAAVFSRLKERFGAG
jgi:hypothetical protein